MSFKNEKLKQIVLEEHSNEDIKLTNNLISIGNLLGIKVIDHLIVGKDKYYSFLENGDI